MPSDSRSAATAFTPFNCNMLVSVVAFARVDQISYLTASGVEVRVDPGSFYGCECLQGAWYIIMAQKASGRVRTNSGASEEGFEQAEEEALT